MTEKNVIICDVCDEHVSKWKCEICSKDICENCLDTISLSFFDGYTSIPILFNINTCEKCKKQFSRVCLSEENIFEDIMKDKPELKNEIIELIKNVLMLKKISDEEPSKEKKEPILIPSPYKPYKPYPPLPPLKKQPYPFPYKSPNPFWNKKIEPTIKKKWFSRFSV